MALTLSIAQVSPSIVANQNAQFTVSITNTSASAVTLTSLAISETTESDAQISQPSYLALNQPVGVGNPVILPAGTVTYGFSAIFSNPAVGTSTNNPFGVAPGDRAQEADSFFMLGAQAQASDGSIGSITRQAQVLSAIYPFPVPNQGTLLFAQGGNLITGLMLGIP